MAIGNAMGRAVVRGHGSTVRSSVSSEAVYGCCRRRGVDSQTTGNTAVVSLPGRFSARIVVSIRGSSTGQFARGFCGSRVTVSLRETGGSQATRDFLGIKMDSIAMELRLPQKKISELKGLIRDWLGRRSCRKRELQSLVGKLQHACKVVKPGRSFLRQMFELLAGVHKDYHHIRLNTSFRSDLVWWDTFLEAWNGKSILRRPFDDAVGDVTLFSDASGSFGCGAWWAHHWFQL